MRMNSSHCPSSRTRMSCVVGRGRRDRPGWRRGSGGGEVLTRAYGTVLPILACLGAALSYGFANVFGTWESNRWWVPSAR